ncbi:MAG: NAD(P)/FAD-dependent oxidoreductase [Deltaproteobacteria bacterium]|nr:MAG: NAD(P)/FAD-dependent oxidoreductase [Deltaproteobacteria bacterium]
MTDYQAIVIGSGAGGLSAALTLSRRGSSVLLLEAMPSFGGYLNPFRRKPYTFNTGLHYLGELGKGEPFWSLLDTLGISDKVSFVELDPDGFDRYIFPDYEFRFCKGKERFRERLMRDFPKEERGIKRFFNVFDKIMKAMDASMSQEGGLFSMLGFLLKHPSMIKYSRIPYQKLLDEVTSDRRLQAVLNAHCGTYGLPPARASVIIPLSVWSHYLAGAYYPKGGSGAFRDAFLNALKSNGAEMKSRSRVVRIEKRGNEFQIETEAGEKYTARVVISDVDPVLTLGKLVDPQMVPSKVQNKVKRLRPSVGAFWAFIGTDLDLPSLGITDANIHHYDDFDLNKIYDTLNASTLPEGVPGYFLTSPSMKDPNGGHAPQNHHTVEIFTFIDYSHFERWANSPSMKRGEEYERFKEQMGQRLVKAAERYIPGLSEHMKHIEYATPLSNEYWVNAVRGGCYGPEETPDQVGPGRFSSFTAGIEGLFLVGAGTLGGGIMACVASGVLAGGRAASLLGLKL